MGTMFAGIVWFAVYVIGLLLPMIAAVLFHPSDVVRPFLPTLGIAFGFLAYPLMICEFGLVGRIRSISVLYGNDVLVYFHKYMGLAALLFVVIHGVLASHGDLAYFNPFSGASMTRYGAGSFWLLLALALTSLYRRQIRLPYASWMTSHYALALAIVALGLTHVLAVRGFSSSGVVRAVMITYFIGFLVPVFRYRVWEYFRMLATPWEVIQNRDEGGRVYTLVAKPVGHPGFEFDPGQFVWLATGPPITAEQHPISISSSAELGPDRRIELSIRSLGDWSGKRVPKVSAGSSVYVNGPFGGMSTDREPGQGFVLIAGGIGITPLRSIILTMKDRGDLRPVLLLYAANTIDDMVYRQELEALQQKMNLKLVLVLMEPPAGWTGERGNIDAALLRRYLPAQFMRFQYFICGPERMMDAMEEYLVALGIPRSRVHSERFDVV
ncbi:MAG TPA: ferredoxin reductase family protein [Rhizomicrobium sp.]|nr:ferredoxin reductase family protein [Rhizomicrobium sp.]